VPGHPDCQPAEFGVEGRFRQLDVVALCIDKAVVSASLCMHILRVVLGSSSEWQWLPGYAQPTPNQRPVLFTN